MDAKYSAVSPYATTGFDAEDHLGYFNHSFLKYHL